MRDCQTSAETFRWTTETREATVHTRVVRLDTGCLAEDDSLEWCTPAERERADSFAFAEDRAHYLAAHWWVRQVVGAHTGLPAADVHLAHDQRGRPVLVNDAAQRAGIDISLAHCGPWAAVAVGIGALVGVDLELAGLRDPAALETLARAYHPTEHAALQSLRGPERSDAILRLWTLKEAFAKALGRGLATVPGERDRLGLAHCAFDVDARPPALVPADERWRFAPLRVPDGVTGSVAFALRPARLAVSWPVP